MPAAHSWVAPQVEIGGKGGRAGGGRGPPPWGLAIWGRRGGGTAPPRCRAPAVACAGGRCPVRSTAPTADQRPALTSPRVRRWARGVAPATSRRHRRHRRSARGRRGGVGLRSASRPRRDAQCTCARCARFARLERVGDLGRDKPLTSRCSVQRVAVRRGGDLALALGEPCGRGCRGSGDLKAWWWADPRLRAIERLLTPPLPPLSLTHTNEGQVSTLAARAGPPCAPQTLARPRSHACRACCAPNQQISAERLHGCTDEDGVGEVSSGHKKQP